MIARVVPESQPKNCKHPLSHQQELGTYFFSQDGSAGRGATTASQHGGSPLSLTHVPLKFPNLEAAQNHAYYRIKQLPSGVEFTTAGLLGHITVAGRNNRSRAALLHRARTERLIYLVGWTQRDQERRNHGVGGLWRRA